MPASLAQTDIIKNALASPATCTASTTAALQALLCAGPQPPPPDKKGTAKGKENKSTGVMSRAKPEAKTRVRAAGSTATSASEKSSQLTPRERYILATEVVNISLKTLTDTLKSPSKAHRGPSAGLSSSSTGHEHARTASAASSGARSRAQNAPSSRALQQLSTDQLQNGQQRAETSRPSSSSRRTSSYALGKTGPTLGITAVADCSRIGFAYLRTAEAEKIAGKDSNTLQLENGMLALAGKLLGHGLDNLAAKELRILKSRLEAAFEGQKGNVRGKGKKATGDTEAKETLATLLHFRRVDMESEALPLVINYQTYVLKMIAAARRPAPVEAAYQFLERSCPSSPANIILAFSERPGCEDKAARQLESFARAILDICPSISSAADSLASDPKASLSPETALRLQHLAFTSRWEWWNLCRHQGNAEKDLLEPFAKCLDTFARRSALPSGKKYQLAKDEYQSFCRFLQLKESSTGAVVALRALSGLAQAAGSWNDAYEWAAKSISTYAASSKTSAASLAACYVRLGALSLERYTLEPGSVEWTDLEATVERSLQHLKGSLKGGPSELEDLLGEAIALRRAGAKILVSQAPASDRSTKPPDSSLLHLCFSAIAGSVQFLARYTGKTPDKPDEKAPSCRQARMALVLNVAKGFYDAALAGCRIGMSIGVVTWEELDTTLQNCYALAVELNKWRDLDYDESEKPLQGPLLPVVKLSNMYWSYYLDERKKTGKKVDNTLRALKRSVDMLRHQSLDQKRIGMMAAKVEKLGNVYESLGRLPECTKAYQDAIRTHVDIGTLADASRLAFTTPIQELWVSDGPIGTLGRALRSLNSVFLSSLQRDCLEGLGFDGDTPGTPTHAALLEWQLHLLCRGINRRNCQQDVIKSALQRLINALLDSFTTEEYPIRRRRTAVVVLRLLAEYPDIIDPTTILRVTNFEPRLSGPHGEDDGLQQYADHISTTFAVHLTFRGPQPSIDTLKASLTRWQAIVDSAGDWASLRYRIDNIVEWIAQLDTIADYFDMQGHEFLRVPTLHLIARVREIQQPLDTDALVSTLSKLGVQLVRLGYSGKAGMVFTKAQQYVNSSSIAAESRVGFHLAHAEYSWAIGERDTCGESLAAAEHLGTSEPGLDLKMSSGTASVRLKQHRLLSEACYASSIFALETGNSMEALLRAKQCVRLNDKIWATLENRSNFHSTPPGASASDEESLHDKKPDHIDPGAAPVVTSMTHESLKGAAFWSFVQLLFRGLSQLSQVLAHQGSYQEATYYAEQARRVANAVNAAPLVVQSARRIAAYHLQSGLLSKGEECLKDAKEAVQGMHPCKDLVKYHGCVAHARAMSGDVDGAIHVYDQAEKTITDLHSSHRIEALERFSDEESSLSGKMADMSLTSANDPPERRKPTRGRKPAAKTPKKPSPRAPSLKRPGSSSRAADECLPLSELQGDIRRRKAVALLLQDKVSHAFELLERAEDVHISNESVIQQMSVRFQALMVQGMKELAGDFTFNGLPESTISFPALARVERRLSESAESRPVHFSPAQNPAFRNPSPRKGVKGKPAANKDFLAILRQAKDCIVDVQPMVLRTSSTAIVQQICGVLSHVTMLLSVTDGRNPTTAAHPLSTAHLLDLPKIHVHEHEQQAINIERTFVAREHLLDWPSAPVTPRQVTEHAVGLFQKDYLDILPESWTAISLSLNDARDELYVTRYQAGHTPFILRLPMARHNSRDQDEEIFGFDEGKAELQDIVELSDRSTKARDVNTKAAKSDWWAEREALDGRLKDLLTNMENIWLGGFRGIFSQHARNPDLLARFATSFGNILKRHLPSRRKTRGKSAGLDLDSRILELFIGLGDATDAALDLDEQLIDLLYFVVDVLQFNGERNAYDEIDFDAMVVETHDALLSYHSAAAALDAPTRAHTILVLDKRLHCFPWESLPSLQPLSISRLPSLAALRTRILAAAPSRTHPALPGHHIPRAAGGTSVLNPSGDLRRTQTTLAPVLASLKSEENWTHVAGVAPAEPAFEDALARKPLLLYFGHGSGAQYIKARTVRRLAPPPPTIPNNHPHTPSAPPDCAGAQAPPPPPPPGCATTLLMGCASAALTEHGDFAPSGMLTAYLAAGAPAVVGTLWDVTDRDCDRLALRCGARWGLWDERLAGGDGAKAGRRGRRGGGGVEVESARGLRGVGRGAGVGEGKSRGGGGGGGESGGKEVEEGMVAGEKTSLVEALTQSRDACYLRYLNGAAAVVYGIPVYLD